MCHNEQIVYIAMLQNHMETALISPTIDNSLSTVRITGLQEQLVYNLTIMYNNSIELGFSEPYLFCKLFKKSSAKVNIL